MRPLKVALSSALFTLALAAASAQTRAPQNRPPTVTLSISSSRVLMADGCGEPLVCTPTASTVQMIAGATDPDGDRLHYTYSATGGRVTGDGANATLDFKGVAPGVYKVTLKVEDGRGGSASGTAAVEVDYCICDPLPPPPQPCPTVDVSCPSEPLEPGTPLKFTAHVSGGDPNATPTFNWAVSAGAISSGRGTSEITVDTNGLPNYSVVTATVDVGGYDRSCATSESCTVMPGCPVVARKVDEYGVISVGDEKLRLDNFVVELQNDPTAQAYLICYGGRRGRVGEARRRCGRALNYVVSTRGIEASRVMTVDGGLREKPAVESWLVPSGAAPPQPAPIVEPRAGSPSRNPPAPRRRSGRRRPKPYTSS